MEVEIRQLKGETEILQAIELFTALVPDIDINDTIPFACSELNREAKLFGVVSSGVIISAAYTFEISLLSKKRVLWILYLVTNENYRSLGYGTSLIEYMESYAKNNGYSQLRVHSSDSRGKANDFYKNKTSFIDFGRVYCMELDEV